MSQIPQVKASVPQGGPHFRSQSRVSPVLLADQVKSEVPSTPASGLSNLLEWLTRLRKPVYSPDHWFIIKKIKGYT